MPQDSKQGNIFLEMNHSETRIDCGGHTFGQAVRRRFLKISQSETIIACGCHACQ
jgi:hypothetical protein